MDSKLRDLTVIESFSLFLTEKTLFTSDLTEDGSADNQSVKDASAYSGKREKLLCPDTSMKIYSLSFFELVMNPF